MPGHARPKHRRDVMGKEPSAIHQTPRFDFSGGARHTDSVWQRFEPFDLCVVENVGALGRRKARVGSYEVLARKNASRGNFQCGEAFYVRFAGANGGAIDDAESSTPFAQPFSISAVSSLTSSWDDATTIFPILWWRNSVRRAELVRQLISAHAVPRLERAGRIVDSGMNHAAVARAREHADLRQRFKDEYVVPARRKRMRNRATHDSAADDDNVCPVHLRCQNVSRCGVAPVLSCQTFPERR